MAITKEILVGKIEIVGEVQAVCNGVWTDAVKLAWKNHLIASKD